MIPPAIQDDAHVALEDRERRRGLLNLLLLSMLVVGGLAWILLLFATPSPELTVDDIRVMNHAVLVSIIAVVATYVIARWISIELAGGLLVCLLVVAGAISDSPEQVTNGRAVVFFALPVLIAGLILPPWASFVAAALCSVAIYWIGVTAGQRVPAIPSMIVLFFIALVAWLFAHSMNRSNAKLHLAVQELRQREADFRVLFADNPLPMCVARTSDAQLIEVNEAAVRHYGYSRDEFLSLKVPDVLVEIAAPLPSSNQLPTTWPYYGEQRHRTKSDDVIDVEISAHRISVFGDDAILVVAQDVTDRKRAEAQRDLMARVVNGSPVSTVIMDPKGVILFVNRTFQELTGMPSAEVVGRSWMTLRRENSDPAVQRAIDLALQQGEVWHTDFDVVRKDGANARMSLSVWGLRDASGVVTNLLSMSEDITARYRAEQALHQLTLELEQRIAQRTAELERANRALERSSRMKDEFLATMSHELRTPLTGILGGADALLDNVYGPLNPRQVRTIHLIHRSGNHLLDVINSILDLSKLEAGGMEIDIQRVNVTDLCISSMQLVSEQAAALNHALSYSCSPEHLMIEADPKRLKQILVNLLNNAVKFTPKDGRIQLAVHADAACEQVTFEVTDNGVGIAEDDKRRLFQPFVQLDSGLNRTYSGTGLGLALVRRLAEMHGGGVGVDSSQGEGSCFRVTLPWRAEDYKPIAGPDMVSHPDSTGSLSLSGILSHPPQILLAEDGLATIQFVWECLTEAGCNVLTITNGAEVMRATVAKRPDLVLMDVQMPYIDGIEAIKQIRASTDPEIAATPIVALNSLAMSGDRERFMAAGANAYLSKPFTVRSLLSIVRELLLGATPAQ